MKEKIYKDFINWAKSILNSETDLKGRKLEIKYFTDGEPYIGTYPDLSYSNFLLNNIA